MFPTGMPRFVHAATSMLSNPTAKLLTTLSCGPARSRNSSSTLSVSRVRTPSQPSIEREQRVARRRQLVLPDLASHAVEDGRRPVVGDDPGDEDLGPALVDAPRRGLAARGST